MLDDKVFQAALEALLLHFWCPYNAPNLYIIEASKADAPQDALQDTGPKEAWD